MNSRRLFLDFIVDSHGYAIRLQLYQSVARHLRIEWSPPQKVQIPDDRADSYTNAIRRHTTKDIQFNVTIMPTRFVAVVDIPKTRSSFNNSF